MRLVSLIGFIFLLGCTTGGEIPDFPDASSRILPDAGYPCDDTTDTQTNFQHCGACFQGCSATDSDRCTEGQCYCGNSLPCEAGSDCREGRCYFADSSGTVCEFDRECRAGYACIEGRCTFIACVPEECDGYDNDCDGLVDNAGESPLSSFCVGDREAPEILYEPCRAGVRVCLEGFWTECQGDIPPVPEVGTLACNGQDEDCDGCIDGSRNEETLMCESVYTTRFDVVYVVDVSGSMKNTLNLVTNGTRLFSDRLYSSDVRYGVVVVPGPSDGVPVVRQDFAGISTLQSTLASLRTTGSIEPQLDTVYMVGTGDLSLSWRDDSIRVVILFTDEFAQSNSIPRLTEVDMCAGLTHGEVFIPVTLEMYQDQFDECAFVSLVLPAGEEGSGSSCAVDADCSETEDISEVCFESICVSSQTRDLVLNLEAAIVDPCDV